MRLKNIIFKRYKIIFNRDEIVEVPILGKKKQIKFAEIESVKIRRSKAISILGKKKKIYIDPAVTEYRKFFPLYLRWDLSNLYHLIYKFYF